MTKGKLSITLRTVEIVDQESASVWLEVHLKPFLFKKVPEVPIITLSNFLSLLLFPGQTTTLRLTSKYFVFS